MFIPAAQFGGMDNLPHAFDPPAQPLRAASRTNLYLAANLVGLRSRHTVTVRNLSATGALVRARGALQDVGPICLVRGNLRAEGTLAWLDGQNGGIRFFQPIDLDQWAPGVACDARCEVDRVAERGEGASATPRHERGASPDPRASLVARIAEELAVASRRLEALGSALADDPAMLARHAGRLRDIDSTAQVLGQLTRLLSSDAPEDELAAIGMEDLRRRLGRAPPL